jgi:hypothetical protein
MSMSLIVGRLHLLLGSDKNDQESMTRLALWNVTCDGLRLNERWWNSSWGLFRLFDVSMDA